MSLLFDHSFRNRAFYNFDQNLTLPRHRWYPFKEGFSSRLIIEATKNIGGRNSSLRIIDPFGGSGTTPLTAALHGHQSLSIEVNPFCAFASRVKCSQGEWNKSHFDQTLDRIMKACRSSACAQLEDVSTFSESGDNEKWLFNREVLRGVSSMLRAIDRHAGPYSKALKLAAIRAAMQCCNAYKDGKCLRYYRDWAQRSYSKVDLLSRFRVQAEMMVHDVTLSPIKRGAKIKIINGDSRRALRRLDDRSFDLLVTSPPYLNSLDYCDVYRPELFVGGFVSNNAELRQIRLKTIRSHVQVKWKGSTEVDNNLLRLVVNQLKERGSPWNKRIPEMIQAYFHDMQNILVQAKRLLRKGGEAWIVVSTSAYMGIQIPVDLILAELGTEAGLKLTGIYVLRQLRAAGQQWVGLGSKGLPLRESLIVLKR